MRTQVVIPIIASILILGSLGLSQQAFAELTPTEYTDELSCDPLFGPPISDEIGEGITGASPTGPFPISEELDAVLLPDDFIGPCPPTDGVGLLDQIVEITNLSGVSWPNVYYVGDAETFFSNVDGLINFHPAFRIDAVGINTPLIFESIAPDGIWGVGETWRFVIQDYSSFGPASAIDSVGIPPLSSGFSGSTGSIIAFADEGSVGGTILPIDTTALLVAGAQTTTPWLILGVISAVGIGLAVFTLKRSR